jgi:ABC-type multidrug transport system ATPase subunit
VLDGVTFAFEPGATYVVAGRSGSGKTTLLNLLAGYVQPDRGTVQVASRVGYLFQEDTLFSSLTARENVSLRAGPHASPGAAPAIVEACLDWTGMGGRCDEPVSVLSGGERQRVQFAGLLAAAPDLVLLDEPTVSMDPRTRRQVAGLIAGVFGLATCVIVTHDEHLADEIGDVVRLVLEDGALRRD